MKSRCYLDDVLKRGILWDIFDPETRPLEIEKVDFPEVKGCEALASDWEALGLVFDLAMTGTRAQRREARGALRTVYGVRKLRALAGLP